MRIRTALAAAALATAGVLGAAGGAVAEDGTNSITGNGSNSAYGNSSTQGDLSPQLGLVQGSLNKLCAGVPVDANVGSLVGVVPVAVQDVPVLSSKQTQQCADNSSQSKGDEALSHLVDGTSVLSGNGTGNR